MLDAVENKNDEVFTAQVFRQVLLEILLRQKELNFIYQLPPRISLKNALTLCRNFLKEKSGGDRALTLAAALFTVIGKHFGLYDKVNRGMINAADEQTGVAGDLECVNRLNELVMMVEVKDRKLSLMEFEATLSKSRQRQINEIFILALSKDGMQETEITEKIDAAYSSGQSAYVIEFTRLAEVVLSLGGESMRKDFLTEVGKQLDAYSTQPNNRVAWKRLLEKL